MEIAKRPLNTLLKNINKHVVVRLKDNSEYKGQMVRCDNYMNIILDGATEYYEGKPLAKYGKIFVRGNNVLYVCIDTNSLA